MRWYSRKLIKDEFTSIPVSRERKRQLRRVASGKCRQAGCKKPIEMGERCRLHRKIDNDCRAWRQRR